MKILRLDFETYSDIDIKKSGMHKYCASPNFEIMLFGYMYIIDGVKQPVVVIDILNGEEVPEEVLSDLTNPDVTKTAYNAPFEIESIECYFKINMDVKQWVCTRIKAGMLGLPMNLEAVGKVLKFDDTKQKIADGKRLIRYFTMPVAKPSKKDGLRTRNFPAHDIEAWQRFKEYNAQDIISEDAIADKIDFFTIPPQEMELWYLDHKINSRGIMLDETMFESAIAIYERFQQEMLDETAEIAGINNPNSRAQLVTWLRSMMDCEVEGLTKADIPILLANTDNVDVIRVLELRKQIAKTSIKKYYSMRSVICDDGRARGLIQFYGANRTGRFAGRLIQVQNLVKNFLVSLGLAREVVRNGEWWILELLYDNIPDTLAQLIRTAFVPSDGNTFYIADYSAIEARVIAWLAGEKWRLDVFATHGKIYEASASKMFKVTMDSISYKDENGNKVEGPNYHMRAKGKISELACGYAGGAGALLNMGALSMGICDEAILLGEQEVQKNFLEWDDQLDGTYKWIHTHNPFPGLQVIGDTYTEEFLNEQGVFLYWSKEAEDFYVRKELDKLIAAWREENPNIVAMWKKFQVSAIAAVLNNCKVDMPFGMSFFMEKGILFMQLPSGRKLSYMRPKLSPDKWGRPSLSYEGMNQTTGKWERISTYSGKLVENAIQAIARDCLAVALLKLDKAGYDIVMHVHDEVVIDAPEADGRLEDIKRIMGEPIDWAPGLYVPAEGYTSPFYKKD